MNLKNNYSSMISIKLTKVRGLGRSATWVWVIFAIITGIYSSFANDVSTPVIKLFIVIPGAYHSWTIVKDSKKVFNQIAIDEQTFKFYFQYAFKDSLSFHRSEVSVEVFEDKIEYKDKKSNELIGTLYKKQLKGEEDWNVLSIHI